MDYTAEKKLRDTRIVLVGKTGVGKSATGNTILGVSAFHQEASSNSVTMICDRKTAVVDGYQVLIVDTPGLCDTERPEDEVVQEIMRCIDISSPGPHVFLIVVAIGRFTKEEVHAVDKIQEIFGERALKYMMVLFTRGGDLDNTIEDYLAKSRGQLKELIGKCGGRYHVFNNKDKNNKEQVTVLLEKIQAMVDTNGGDCYTNVMYQTVEKYKKKEGDLEKEIQDLKTDLHKKKVELENKTQLMTQDLNKKTAEASALKEKLAKMALEETTKTKEEIETREKEACVNKTKNDMNRQGVAHLRRMFEMEERRRADQARHKQRMEEAELKMQLATVEHERKIKEERERLESQRLAMIKEHERKMEELRREIVKTTAEKEEYMRKNLAKKSKGCSIS